MKKLLTILLIAAMMLTTAAMAESLTMYSSIDFAPYEYYDDETGEIVGIDVEIAQAVAAKLGYDLVIEDVQFDGIIAAVVAGKADFGMSGFTVTEERKQSVDFTTSYTTSKQTIVVPVDSEITSVDDIFNVENKFSIGVQLGTTSDLYITDDIAANGLQHEVMQYNKAPDTIVALNSGKIDCAIMDDQVALAFVKSNEGLKALETAYVIEEYAICFPKESEIFADFNAALEELIADGTVQSIIDKYITAE